MNRRYEDLMALTPEPPTFFQKDGVPRWEAFEPGRSTDVYSVEAVTMEISCQVCDARFHVLMERESHGGKKTLAERILDGSIHYGDPPNTGCCDCGPSMNSEPVRILGHWSRTGWEWTRDPSLEVSMRRLGDPMTDAMREKAQDRLVRPETDEETRTILKEALELDVELRARAEETGTPVHYSRYAEAAPI